MSKIANSAPAWAASLAIPVVLNSKIKVPMEVPPEVIFLFYGVNFH